MKRISNVHKMLEERRNLRFLLIFQGIVVGILVAIVIVLNRLAINKLSVVFKNVYIWARGGIFNTIVLFILLAFLGYITGIMVKKEPMISGSGIPQVKGILQRKLKINWLRVLILKFVGGVIALSAGLSLGREGPSVQIGGAIGEGFSKASDKASMRKGYLITSGASAGLAAAFNSPVSGVMFALEELHRSFSPLVLLPAMAASIMADFIAKQFLGMDPALNFRGMSVIPLNFYWTLIILGILVGAISTFFTKGIVVFQNLYGKIKKVPIEFKVMIPFIITGIAGLISPMLLGGGHEIIMELETTNMSIPTLIIIFIVKFILLLICFGSGAPGGIFLPMLLLGSLLGDIFGIAICNITNIPQEYILNFVIFAMAGYFSAVVRAPITGLVLITEMTGSFEHLLSISIVVFISYLTAELLKSEPVYEVLLERTLKKFGVLRNTGSINKVLAEVAVEMGSLVDGKMIKDISWPCDCLLVSVKRGEKEIIPRGTVEILSGDYLIALADAEVAAEVVEKLKIMTLAE